MTDTPEGTGIECFLRHVSAWTDLNAAEHVQVYRNGRLKASGNVDTVTAGGDIVWLFQDHGLGRILFQANDNVDVFRDHNRQPRNS